MGLGGAVGLGLIAFPSVCRYFLSTEKVNAQYTPEFLAQRRQDLEQWMQRLHRIPCVACFPVFLSFIEADKNEAMKTYITGPPEIAPVIKGVTLDEATQVLAKSHMENPLWKHIFPLLSDKDLFEALNGVLGLYALTCFEYGYAMAIKEGAQMNSVCLLIPPGALPSLLQRSWRASVRVRVKPYSRSSAFAYPMVGGLCSVVVACGNV